MEVQSPDRLGWRNVTTWVDEAELTENWRLYFKLNGALMVRGLGFTRTNSAPPFTEADRAAAMQRIEREVRAEGGIF